MFKLHQNSEREYPSNNLLDHLAVSALCSHFFPDSLQYIFFIISNLQVLAILLWTQFELVMNLDDSSYLYHLCEFFKVLASKHLFGSTLTSFKLTSLMIGIWIYFILFLTAFAIVLKNFYQKVTSSKTETLFIAVIGQIHQSVGFWTINITLVDILFTDYENVQQQEFATLFSHVLAPIFVVLNYVICAFFSILAHNPFVQSSALSVYTPLFQIGTFIFKAVISLTPLLPVFLEGWGFIILSLTLLIYQCYKLMTCFPYFEYFPMQVALGFSSLFLSISMINLLAYAFDSLAPELILCLESLLILLVFKASQNHLNASRKEYLAIDNRELRSEQQVLKKVFALRYMFNRAQVTLLSNKQATSNELHFWGVLSSLIRENNLSDLKEMNINQECVIEDLRKYYSKCEQRIINFVLKDAMRKLNHTDKLKIMVCSLGLEYEEQVSTTLYSLTKITKPKGLQRIVALKLHQKVQQNVYRFFKQEKTLDLQSYMDLESISSNFLQMVSMGAKKFLSFWGSFKKSGTKVTQLYETNLEMEKISEDIQSFWKQCIESNRVFANSLNTIYSIFLALVRNRPALARKIIERYDSVRNIHVRDNEDGPLSIENLSSSNNITFYASMSKGKTGKILYVTPNTTELLGWTPGELEGLNISKLVPAFMQKRHDAALMEHVERISDNIVSPRLYKNLMTFVTDKQGFKVPCYVYLSLYPYVSGELVYTAIVRLRRSENKIILVDEKGNIEGFTRDIVGHFNLDPNKTVKMKEICENPHIIERVLDNLSNMIKHKAATDRHGRKLSETFELKVPESSPANKTIITTDLSEDLSETINANFYSPHEHSAPGRKVFHMYSIHITMRKVWESYFFVLKLKEHVMRGVRGSLLSPHGLMLKLPEMGYETTSESKRITKKHKRFVQWF